MEVRWKGHCQGPTIGQYLQTLDDLARCARVCVLEGDFTTLDFVGVK